MKTTRRTCAAGEMCGVCLLSDWCVGGRGSACDMTSWELWKPIVVAAIGALVLVVFLFYAASLRG